MAVIEAEMKFFQAALVPTDDVSPAGGLASVTELTGVCGEWFPKLVTPVSGTDEQYQKAHIGHLNGVDTAFQTAFWMRNLIVPLASPSRVSFFSNNAQDDATKKARIWGHVAGSPIFDDVVLAGAAQVISGPTFDAGEIIIEVLTNPGSAPTTTHSTGSDPNLNRGLVIQEYNAGSPINRGVVPEGYGIAFGNFEFAIDAAKNDPLQVANRKTAPALTFFRPNSLASALQTQDLVPADRYGIWGHQTVYAGWPTFNCKNALVRWGGSDT